MSEAGRVRRLGRCLAGPMVLGLLLATSAPAGARGPSAEQQKKDAAKKQFEAGDRAYKLGRFEEALTAFSAAYETLPLPAFLFNIGQCHRQLGNHERAIFFFEGYLREMPTAKNRQVVEDLLTQTRAEIERQKQAVRDEAERKRRDEEAAHQAEELKRKEENLRLERERAELDARTRTVVAAQVGGSPTSGGTVQQQMPPEETPIWGEWWFWAAVGGAVAVAGGVTAVVVLGRDEKLGPPPSGSIGTIDARIIALPGGAP